MALVLIVLVGGLTSGTYQGLEAPLIYGSFLNLGILGWLFTRSKRKRAKGPGQQPSKSRVRHEKPVKVNRPNIKLQYVDSVAEKLRELARNYEEASNEVFLVLRDLRIRRVTGSQDFLANAVVKFSRQGFRADFVTLNSKTGKPRSLEKRWRDTIGATPDRFEIYLKDHSFIELIPLDRDTHLFLSAFWQVFNPGLNGYPEQFQSPVKSGLGHRLREVANYIVENKSEIGPEGALDVESVPTRVTMEEFSGIFDPKMPEIGDKLGRWRLTEALGSGAFGNVYLVEHVDEGSVRALKLMSSQFEENKLQVDSRKFRLLSEGFLDEAVLSQKVNSPFVVSAIESGEDPWPWILFPYIDGGSPKQEMLNASDPRSVWWNLAHDLLSGLHAIHTEGLVHRDVKPDNIRGTSGRFLLLDFGIGQVKGYSELLNRGLAGTPGYIQPELLLDRNLDYDYSGDIFAAGMTLLSLFDDESIAELRGAHALLASTSDSQPLTSFMAKPIALEKAPSEARPLLDAMLNTRHDVRSHARNLLTYVADFVDIEEKIDLIQTHRAELYKSVSVDDQSQESRTVETLKGPFASWSKLEAEIYKLLETARPRYFIVELKVRDRDETIYVQAMNDGQTGWHIEAVSETFADDSQSSDMKRRMMRLGWAPPSGSEPNWGKDFQEPPFPEVVRVFTDAFEFGYEVKPNQVESIDLIKQGEGHY